MKKRYSIALWTFFLAIMLQGIRLTAQEIQVPVCEGIQVITKELAKDLPEFEKYTDFQQATVYKDSGNQLILEVIHRQDGNLVRSRVPVKREDLDQMCATLSAKMSSTPTDEYDPDRDGRRKIIGATMTYSLLYYAWAIPSAFHLTDGSAYAGSYLIIGSAGYFIPMLATQNVRITPGMAKGYTYGCFLGIPHGWALGALLTGSSDANFALGTSVVTSIGEGLGGLYYARQHKLGRAHMRMMGSMGSWGLLYGLGIPAIGMSEDITLYSASSLAFSAAGIWGGDQLAKKFKPSDGDVSVINGLGFLGGYLPIPLVYSLAGENGSAAAYIGSAILGSGLGISYGLHKTRSQDYSRSQGNIIVLGEIAGGLIGAGVSVLSGAEATASMWLVGAGLLGGFIASDLVITNPGKDKKTSGANLSFDFNPVAFQKLIARQEFSFVPGKPFQNPDLVKFGLKF